jgi:hypothetical protein
MITHQQLHQVYPDPIKLKTSKPYLSDKLLSITLNVYVAMRMLPISLSYYLSIYCT